MPEFEFLTREEFVDQRGELAPFFYLLQPYTDGETTPQELILKATDGGMLVGVMRHDGKPIFVVGLTFSVYPGKKVMHIALASGTHSKAFVRHFFKAIHIAARAHNCQDIEARCRPSMARLVRRYGRGMALREFTTFRLPAQE